MGLAKAEAGLARSPSPEEPVLCLTGSDTSWPPPRRSCVPGRSVVRLQAEGVLAQRPVQPGFQGRCSTGNNSDDKIDPSQTLTEHHTAPSREAARGLQQDPHEVCPWLASYLVQEAVRALCWHQLCSLDAKGNRPTALQTLSTGFSL